MNFLPFVFTLLLLLTFISSFLFSSVMGTARENKVILSQRHAYLKLLSNQHHQLYKSMKKKTENAGEKKPQQKRDKTPKKVDEKPRSSTEGFEKSKLNLIMMLSSDQPQKQKILEETAIRLIDILYRPYEFYHKTPVKDVARTIVKQIIKDKIECFEELRFDNPELNEIYYKMLKGTNTSYPALSEYFSLNKQIKSAIYFRYASKPVLRVLLGDGLAKSVFDAELNNWEKNKLRKVLPKEEFIALTKNDPQALIKAEVLDFSTKHKGPIQIHHEISEKIRAIHPVESVEL
jgi:hypothetical protein